MEPEVQCRIHKGSPIIPILSRINPIPQFSSRPILILSSHLLLGLPKGLFPVGLPVNILKALLPSFIRATCPAHLNLLDLFTLTILGKRYKLWSSLYLFISRTALIYKLPSGLWSRCLLLFLLPDLSPMSVVDILRGLTLVLLMKQQ